MYVELNVFADTFLVEVGLFNCNPVLRGARNHLHQGAFERRFASGDSGLQLDVGDCAIRCLSENPAPAAYSSRAEDKLKRRIT